jgi:hypothetical protein
MDWSADEPPYPSALGDRPVPPLPGNGWAMVAVIARAELRDGLRDLRQWLSWRLHTSRGECREPLRGWADEVARFGTGDHLAPWGDARNPLDEFSRRWQDLPGEGEPRYFGETIEPPPLTRPARLRRFLLDPPPEDDSFI